MLRSIARRSCGIFLLCRCAALWFTSHAERQGWKASRRPRPIGTSRARKLAVTEVALVVTVSEPGRNSPQVSPPARLTAERTEGLRARCPVIDQNEEATWACFSRHFGPGPRM